MRCIRHQQRSRHSVHRFTSSAWRVRKPPHDLRPTPTDVSLFPCHPVCRIRFADRCLDRTLRTARRSDGIGRCFLERRPRREPDCHNRWRPPCSHPTHARRSLGSLPRLPRPCHRQPARRRTCWRCMANLLDGPGFSVTARAGRRSGRQAHRPAGRYRRDGAVTPFRPPSGPA